MVSPRGEYLGGAIAPGIEISLEALGRRGAQLRKVELLRPRSVIAKNTVEALQSGIVYGFAGQVDGIVAGCARSSGSRAPSVTWSPPAGSRRSWSTSARAITDHQPWLTLLGLEIVFEPQR